MAQDPVGQLDAQLHSRVTLVEVADTVAAHVRGALERLMSVEEMPGVEQLLTASELGTLSTEVIVLGVELEEPVAVAQRVLNRYKNVQIVILTQPGERAALERRLSFTPFIGDEVVACSLSRLDELPRIVKRAVKRSHRRVSPRRSSGSAQSNVEDLRPRQIEVTHYLDNMLDHAPIGIITIDPDGKIVTLNKRARDILGVSESQVLATPFVDFFNAWDQKRVQTLLRRAADGEASGSKESLFRIDHADGERRFAEITASALTGSADSGTMMIILNEVTDRVRAEKARNEAAKALQESEDRIWDLAEVLRLIPWEADPSTWSFTYVGQQAEEILGYPIARWYEPSFWSERLHPDDRSRALKYCADCSRRLQNFDFEYRMIGAGGQTLWFRDLVNVRRDDTGRAVKLRGFMLDVTERKFAG